MLGKVTPEKAISFVRFSIGLVCAWPRSPESTRAQVLCFRILRLFSFLSALGLFLPVLTATIHSTGDSNAFSKASFMAIATGQVCANSIISFILHDRFQRLIENVTSTIKYAKSYERNVYQRYVDTYYKFYGLTTTWYYLSATIVIVGSIFLPQPFPTISEYPFPVDYEPMRTVIFMHQAFVGFQCSATVSTNMFAALLLLNAATRYEVLMIDIRKATTTDALIMCMKQYATVNRFAKDVVNSVQYIAGCTIIFSSMKVVLCGLTIIGRASFLVRLQFIALSWTVLMEVFTCALPADSLITMSSNAVQSVYETTWYDQVLDVQKTVLRILVPQEPVVIRFKCFVPALSLEYYCSYLSHAVSVFTALRMVLGEDVEFLSSSSTNSTCCIE